MALERMKIKVVVKKKLANMEDWKSCEYWKRVTCIMLIRVGYQDVDIMIAAQRSVNTVTYTAEMETTKL